MVGSLVLMRPHVRVARSAILQKLRMALNDMGDGHMVLNVEGHPLAGRSQLYFRRIILEQ